MRISERNESSLEEGHTVDGYWKIAAAEAECIVEREFRPGLEVGDLGE